MTIPIRIAAARLLRVADIEDEKDWYVRRDSVTNAPLFLGPVTECVEVLRLESPKPWPQADAVYIRELIRERFNTRGASDVR